MVVTLHKKGSKAWAKQAIEMFPELVGKKPSKFFFYRRHPTRRDAMIRVRKGRVK